ncbi:MAG: sugar transferase [Acidimicrobiales bacterium]|nr:sugar transferase [Acidimicrobiales bacterium]
MAPRTHRPAPLESLRRAIDVVAAGSLLGLLSVPLLVTALIIRLESRGPALFRQERVGRAMETFTLYKFRTMQVGSDDRAHRALVHRHLRDDGSKPPDTVQKLVDDPRLTRLGPSIRRWSIDEFPQLINVLRGEMTLVGPRPCLPWEAEMFTPEQQQRFSVKPGLTGLWQVSGRGGLTMKEALDLDVEYVRRRSLWLDLRLLVKTPGALLRSRNETA